LSHSDATVLIRIEDLAKHYHEGGARHTVFSALNGFLRRGEIVALLGSSGSGKSTLLHLVAGLDRSDAGRIVIDGRDIASLDETARTLWRRREVGLVFQFFNLIPTLTVAENARLPLSLNRLDDAEHRQQLDELLERVGLAGYAQRFPEQLSGGEQQRLAIVRALIHGPRLLLADEPTGNLDERTGERVLELLLELVRPAATTVLLVTHDRRIAERCDRVLELHNGELNEHPPEASSV
jgi:putative ABC transport system ATP-binding protein